MQAFLRQAVRSSLLLACACGVQAQITNLKVVGTTATQAVISYTAPTVAACQVEISASDTYSPVVNDVDTILFPGSSLDTRAGSVTNGLNRNFVAGKRSADMAVDGNRYSRALQANASYFFRVTCGTDTATGTFATTNILLGQSFNDPLPVDPANPGQYAWPTLSRVDRTQQIVDPQTGMLLQRLGLPNDLYDGPTTSAFVGAYDAAGAWSGVNNVLADDSAVSTFSAANSAPLFLDAGLSIYLGGTHGTSFRRYAASFNWLQASVNAWCSGSGCATAASADRTLQVALTVDGVTPATNWLEQVLPACASNCTGSARFTIGGQTPILADWTPSPGFDITDVSARSGSANRNGTAVTWVSGNYFNINWGPGSRITINSVGYTIASVNSEQSLTLTAGTGTDSGALFVASNFGLLIRKKTASLDQISLQFANATYVTGIPPSWDASGDEDVNSNCSNALVAGPGGEMGYHCNIGASLQWIGSNSGTVIRLGYPNFPSRAGVDGWTGAFCASNSGPFWDKTDGSSLYCSMLNANGETVIVKATYSGPDTDVGDRNQFVKLGECGSPPCWTFTNRTPPSQNRSLSQLLSAFTADWRGFTSAPIQLTGPAGPYLALQARIQNGGDLNNTRGFVVIFDPTPAVIVAATPAWKYYPNRWGALHGPILINDPNWMAIPSVGARGPFSGSDVNGNGPFYSRVTSGGIGTQGQACPAWDPTSGIAQAEWPTGSNCVTLAVDGEPCDPTPGPNEPSDGGAFCGTPSFYFLQKAAPRDLFCIVDDATQFAGNGNNNGCHDPYQGTEFFRLLIKNGNSWVAQRGWFGTGNPAQPFRSHAASSYAVFLPTSCSTGVDGPFVCTSALTYWNYTADPAGLMGLSYVDTNDQGGGHSVTRSGLNVSAVSSRCPQIDGMANGCYNVRRASLPALLQPVNTTASNAAFGATNYIVANNPTFAGKAGEGQPNSVDSHPSYTQYPLAPSSELSWFTDARPFLGDTSLTASAAQLVSGTLYKFSAAQFTRLRSRQLPTLAACGVNPLADVSSPTSVITGTAADKYKYCAANAAGECSGSSAPGDVYVNCPLISTPSCPYMGVGGLDSDVRGICIADNGARTQGLTQTSVASADPTGAFSRVLTHGLSRYFWTDQFWNVKTSPDGKWLFFRTPWADGQRDETFLARIPPFPPEDTVNRGDFEVLSLPLTPVPGLGANNAIVEFGYNTSFHCTTRQDACVRGSQSGTDYAFASESPAGAPCATSCTVSIPAVPQRVLYYRVSFRDAQNNILQRSYTGVLAIP